MENNVEMLRDIDKIIEYIKTDIEAGLISKDSMFAYNDYKGFVEKYEKIVKDSLEEKDC